MAKKKEDILGGIEIKPPSLNSKPLRNANIERKETSINELNQNFLKVAFFLIVVSMSTADPSEDSLSVWSPSGQTQELRVVGQLTVNG